jgi:hypothetical protein
MKVLKTAIVNRLPQVVLILSTIAASWWGMQAVHELGHVLGALATGGKVTRVVLHPLSISRTDVSPNPQPLIVVWTGPAVGVVAPLAIWGAAVGIGIRGAYVLRFFAGFSLIANGLYIAGGSFDGVGDCGEMLRHGSPIWTLWLFGMATAPGGLWLWHRQGTHFGLGAARGKVDGRVAVATFAFCIVLAGLGFLFGAIL